MTMDPGFLQRASGRVSSPPLVYGYTILTLPSGGHCRFDRCVADVFDRGELTLTSAIDGHECTFLSGEWTEAAVFGQDGHLEYALRPASVMAERQAS